jgi:hypothetical protein
MERLTALVIVLSMLGCAQTGSKKGDAAMSGGNRAVAASAGADETVALDQVPESVRKAAEAAVPGFAIQSAEKEVEDGTTLYSLEGTAGGKPCEVEVTADGKVLEIEGQDDDGEDDDGDGGDDED